MDFISQLPHHCGSHKKKKIDVDLNTKHINELVPLEIPLIFCRQAGSRKQT